MILSKTSPCWKKINYSLLAWWTLNIYAHRSACLLTFHKKTLYFILSPNLSCTDRRWVHTSNKGYTFDRHIFKRYQICTMLHLKYFTLKFMIKIYNCCISSRVKRSISLYCHTNSFESRLWIVYFCYN